MSAPSYADLGSTGQRQSRPAGRGVVLTGGALLALGAFSGAFAGSEFTLPAPARSVVASADGAAVVASMALSGVSFLSIKEGRVVGQEHHADWPTLDALEVGEGRYLLAGRFGTLNLVERRPSADGSAFEAVAEWPTDGLPTSLVWSQGRLYVASGAAGVMIYDWDRTAAAPVLRGRFPFVDFSKEVRCGENNMVLVADNYDTGLQVLDAGDELRPRMTERRGMDYVDAVATFGDHVAATSRREGTAVFRISGSGALSDEVTLPLPSVPPGERRPIATSVEYDAKGRLLVCEEVAGARLFAPKESGGGYEEVLHLDAAQGGRDGGFLDGVFLGEDAAAFSTYDGRLIIESLKPR